MKPHSKNKNKTTKNKKQQKRKFNKWEYAGGLKSLSNKVISSNDDFFLPMGSKLCNTDGRNVNCKGVGTVVK